MSSIFLWLIWIPGQVLHFRNHVNLIAISNHQHYHNSDLRCLQFIWTSPEPILSYSEVMPTPSLLSSLSYSKLIFTQSSLLLRAHYHWHILCHCYSVIIGRYQLGLFTHQRISSTQTLNLHFRVQACTEWSLIFFTCLFIVSEFTCSYILCTHLF